MYRVRGDEYHTCNDVGHGWTYYDANGEVNDEGYNYLLDDMDPHFECNEEGTNDKIQRYSLEKVYVSQRDLRRQTGTGKCNAHGYGIEDDV